MDIPELKQAVSSAVDLLESALLEIETGKQQLKKDQDEFQRKISQQQSKFSATVNLNVGGEKFTTTKATLSAEEGTFFHTMVSSGVWQPDDNGEYYIDRDPQYFREILNYLREGKLDGKIPLLDPPALSEENLTCLRGQVDFLQISTLMKSLKPRQHAKFIGYAPWTQDARQDSDELQDQAMDKAAAKAFPGSRAATHEEYEDGLIVNLPKRNESGYYVLFTGEGCAGECSGTCKSGHGRAGIQAGSPLTGRPESYNHKNLIGGRRTCIAVKVTEF